MSLNRVIPVVPLLLLALASACGKDKPTSPSDSSTALTAAEFNGMVDALAAANAFGFGRSGFAANPAAPTLMAQLAAQTSQTITIDQNQACPGGGSAHIDGTATPNASGAQSGTITMYLHLTFNGCKASSADGQSFTFEGNPTLNMAVDATYAPGTMTMIGHDSGDFRWSTNGKTGSCPFNVLVTITGVGVTSTGRAQGDICGNPIDKTF